MNFWKFSTLVLTFILMLSLTINVLVLLRIFTNTILGEFFTPSGSKYLTGQAGQALTKSVLAEEIYPLFFCPCCGSSIEQCTCPMAKERKAYIDGLVKTEASEDEIILAYVKKYGLNSFVDENKQKEVRERLIAEAPADRSVISLIPDSYDFGDVSQKEGVATTFFEIRNEGEKDLIIDRIETSCGCTSASVVFRSKEGPRFYMPGHGKENPTDWQVAISPGQTAQLKVYYDPYAHEDFRGAATREISVFSNDAIDFEKKVKIELNQVD